MKHIQSIEEFKMINEQLFGNIGGEILNLLGMGEGDYKEAGASIVNGKVKVNITGGDKGKNIQLLLEAMKRHDITNPYTQIAILSCIGKETGFVPKHEYSYEGTPNGRLRTLFGDRLKGLSDAQLEKLKKDNVKFFDRIYGVDDPTKTTGKQLGNTSPGDGWKYCAASFNGLTGKANWEAMQKLLDSKGKLNRKVDIIANPQIFEKDIEAASESAILYFLAYTPAVFKKYGVENINGFKDLKTAIKAIVHTNAGAGNSVASIESSEGYKKATEVAQNFNVADLKTTA